MMDDNDRMYGIVRKVKNPREATAADCRRLTYLLGRLRDGSDSRFGAKLPLVALAGGLSFSFTCILFFLFLRRTTFVVGERRPHQFGLCYAFWALVWLLFLLYPTALLYTGLNGLTSHSAIGFRQHCLRARFATICRPSCTEVLTIQTSRKQKVTRIVFIVLACLFPCLCTALTLSAFAVATWVAEACQSARRCFSADGTGDAVESPQDIDVATAADVCAYGVRVFGWRNCVPAASRETGPIEALRAIFT